MANKIRTTKAISFFKADVLLLSFSVIALAVSFRVWPGTFPEVMGQRFVPRYDPVKATDSGIWPLPAPQWLSPPVVQLPAKPEFSALPDRRDAIEWWKEWFRQLEQQLTGKNSEKGPDNQAKSSKLWVERKALNHLNDPESSDGYIDEDADDEEDNDSSSITGQAHEAVLLAINPSPSIDIDTRPDTRYRLSGSLTASNTVKPRQVPTDAKTNQEASNTKAPESTSLPAASATETSGLPLPTPLLNLETLKEELARESEQCLEHFKDSYTYRVINHTQQTILSGLTGFNVEDEPYLEQARQDPKAFSDMIRKRREEHGADSFPFPETEPVVKNMEAGIRFFLQDANEDDSPVYNDFLNVLDEVKTNNYRYREVMLACWIFTVLADLYYSARGEYERVIFLVLDQSLRVNSFRCNPEQLTVCYRVLTTVLKQQSSGEDLLNNCLYTRGSVEIYNNLSDLLKNPDTLFLPGFSPLDIDFFDKTTPYLLMAASLLNMPLIEADATLISPFRFFTHDVAHAHFMLKRAGANSDCLDRNQPYEPFRDALVNFLAKARQALPKSVSTATTLISFYFQHESTDACLWQLPDLPLASYFYFACEMRNSRKNLKIYSDSTYRCLIMENPDISDSDYLYAALFLWITIQQARYYRQQPETLNSLADELTTETRRKWENAVNLTMLARKISRAFINHIRDTRQPDWEQWEQRQSSNKEHLLMFDKRLFSDIQYLIYFLLIALDPDQSTWFFRELQDWLASHPEQLRHLTEVSGSDDFRWLVPESFLPFK